MNLNDPDFIPFDSNLPTGFDEFRTGDKYFKNKPKVFDPINLIKLVFYLRRMLMT